MKKYFNPNLILLRLIAMPLLLGIILIKYAYSALKQSWLVLRWGGEWVTYDKDSQKRMQDIHDLLND